MKSQYNKDKKVPSCIISKTLLSRELEIHDYLKDKLGEQQKDLLLADSIVIANKLDPMFADKLKSNGGDILDAKDKTEDFFLTESEKTLNNYKIVSPLILSKDNSVHKQKFFFPHLYSHKNSIKTDKLSSKFQIF